MAEATKKIRVIICDDDGDVQLIKEHQPNKSLILHSKNAEIEEFQNVAHSIVIVGRAGTSSLGLTKVQECVSDTMPVIALVRAFREYTASKTSTETKSMRRRFPSADHKVVQPNSRVRTKSEEEEKKQIQPPAPNRISLPPPWQEIYSREDESDIIAEWWSKSLTRRFCDRVPVSKVIPMESDFSDILDNLNLTLNSKSDHSNCPDINFFSSLYKPSPPQNEKDRKMRRFLTVEDKNDEPCSPAAKISSVMTKSEPNCKGCAKARAVKDSNLQEGKGLSDEHIRIAMKLIDAGILDKNFMHGDQGAQARENASESEIERAYEKSLELTQIEMFMDDPEITVISLISTPFLPYLIPPNVKQFTSIEDTDSDRSDTSWSPLSKCSNSKRELVAQGDTRLLEPSTSAQSKIPAVDFRKQETKPSTDFCMTSPAPDLSLGKKEKMNSALAQVQLRLDDFTEFELGMILRAYGGALQNESHEREREELDNGLGYPKSTKSSRQKFSPNSSQKGNQNEIDRNSCPRRRRARQMCKHTEKTKRQNENKELCANSTGNLRSTMQNRRLGSPNRSLQNSIKSPIITGAASGDTRPSESHPLSLKHNHAKIEAKTEEVGSRSSNPSINSTSTCKSVRCQPPKKDEMFDNYSQTKMAKASGSGCQRKQMLTIGCTCQKREGKAIGCYCPKKKSIALESSSRNIARCDVVPGAAMEQSVSPVAQQVDGIRCSVVTSPSPIAMASSKWHPHPQPKSKSVDSSPTSAPPLPDKANASEPTNSESHTVPPAVPPRPTSPKKKLGIASRAAAKPADEQSMVRWKLDDKMAPPNVTLVPGHEPEVVNSVIPRAPPALPDKANTSGPTDTESHTEPPALPPKPISPKKKSKLGIASRAAACPEVATAKPADEQSMVRWKLDDKVAPPNVTLVPGQEPEVVNSVIPRAPSPPPSPVFGSAVSGPTQCEKQALASSASSKGLGSKKQAKMVPFNSPWMRAKSARSAVTKKERKCESSDQATVSAEGAATAPLDENFGEQGNPTAIPSLSMARGPQLESQLPSESLSSAESSLQTSSASAGSKGSKKGSTLPLLQPKLASPSKKTKKQKVTTQAKAPTASAAAASLNENSGEQGNPTASASSNMARDPQQESQLPSENISSAESSMQTSSSFDVSTLPLLQPKLTSSSKKAKKQEIPTQAATFAEERSVASLIDEHFGFEWNDFDATPPPNITLAPGEVPPVVSRFNNIPSRPVMGSSTTIDALDFTPSSSRSPGFANKCFRQAATRFLHCVRPSTETATPDRQKAVEPNEDDAPKNLAKLFLAALKVLCKQYKHSSDSRTVKKIMDTLKQAVQALPYLDSDQVSGPAWRFLLIHPCETDRINRMIFWQRTNIILNGHTPSSPLRPGKPLDLPLVDIMIEVINHLNYVEK